MSKTAILEQLINELRDAQGGREKEWIGRFRHDLSGSTATSGFMHGPGGLMTFPGVDNDVFHTMMGANSLLSQLPTMPSVYTNPTYFTLTGITDVSGSNPTTLCADAAEAGILKGCLTTAPFGLFPLATAKLNVPRLGQRNDRADPLDLRLVGSPMAGANGPFGGIMNAQTPGDLFTNEVASRFWELALAYYFLLSVKLWSGTPANNQSSGSYKEFPGFESLVNTGYVDAETNTSCSAMDSYVVNYNYGRVSDSGAGIVAAMTNMAYQLKDRATRMGMMPVRWVIAMKPQAFYEITAVWPCAYMTYRCGDASASQPNNMDAAENIRLRDAMRSGKYLLIDGIQYDVIVDDGISELNGNETGSVPRGCFATDIFFIPMSVAGGRAVTYLEYFQYNNASINEVRRLGFIGTIEGGFLTWPKQTNACIQWQAQVEPRLILRTPWLAGRLQNIAYCPVQHTRDAFPAEPYFVSGGKSSRSGPSFYSLWQS